MPALSSLSPPTLAPSEAPLPADIYLPEAAPVEPHFCPRSHRKAQRKRRSGRVLGGAMRLLAATLRVSVRGEDHVHCAETKAQAGGRGALFAVWHGQMIVPALWTRDRDYVVLISRSGDGDIATSALHCLGWRVRRGSAFEGATQAARGVLCELMQGRIVAITPDGPRGPSRQAAPGTAYLAARAGCEVHPVGTACQGWRLSTWDAMSIPRPFGRAAIVIGSPLRVESCSRKALEDATQRLQAAVEECEAQAHQMIEDAQSRARSRVTFWVFNALLLPLWPALAAYTLWRRFGQAKSARSLAGQWGHVPPEAVQAMHEQMAGAAPMTRATRIWLHAVSVGEAMAARPVARALREAMPDCRIGLTVTTDTGYETAQAALKAGDVDAVWHFPADWPWAVSHALKKIRPHAFLTMETELWPNFLHLAREGGAQTFLVNGRVSDNLLKTAPRLGPLWTWMTGNLNALLMRSSFDAERMKTLGASPAQVQLVGDVKLDQADEDNAPARLEQRTKWRRELGIAEDAPFWAAGSTHPGEEDMVLDALARLREQWPDLRLLIAPRHIERADEVAQLCQDKGFQVSRRTKGKGQRAEDVLLLDTVGELAQIYAACDVAFVGGSLIRRGGHNLLEPVLAGAPVVFGPHVQNFREAATLARESNVGRQVEDAPQLAEATSWFLSRPDECASVPQRAREALSMHRGACRRVAEVVARALEK